MNGFDQVYPAMTGSEIIIKYGETFDGENYKRAMADEFERDRYWKRIVAKVADEVRKIDFNEKFTFAGWATLGEYSFESHSFPIVAFPSHKISISGLDVTAFTTGFVVNGNDFNWSLPMSETDASAFVKSRSTGGTVNRNIPVRITYSIADTKGEPLSYEYGIKWRPQLNSFIYSVEVFNDPSLTRKLGIISKTNLLGPNAEEEWHSAAIAAQTPTKEIGKYRYKAEYRHVKLENPLNPRPQLFGTLILTDVGFSMLDDQPDGRYEKRDFKFYNSKVTTVSRGKGSYRTVHGDFEEFYVWCGEHLKFETQQERDRFFSDLSHAFQEWKLNTLHFNLQQEN